MGCEDAGGAQEGHQVDEEVKILMELRTGVKTPMELRTGFDGAQEG